MNVLSLFDGMSCGQIALKQLGVIPEVYYASEVDKHAIKQTQLNFPNTIQLGDVTRVDVSQLEPIDLLIGGSPCQSFSFAGKRVGMSTTDKEEIYTLNRYLELKEEGFQFEGESYLFWEYMRILNDIRKYNPNVKFLLENVEMGKKWERTLSEAIGLFGVHINSALVSAQNRKRIYWTNIRTKQMGLFGDVYSDIPQPEDRGFLLKDILEDGVDDKYYLNADVIDKLVQHRERHKELVHGFGAKCHNKDEKMQALKVGGKGIDDLVIDANGHIDSDKTGTITSRYGKGVSNFGSDPFILDTKMKMKPDQGKSGTFTTGGNSGGLHSDMDLICVAMRGRTPEIPSDQTSGYPSEQRLEPRNDGKTNTPTNVQKDNLIMQLNPSKESGGNQPYQQNRVYDINGIVPYKQNDDNSIFQLPRGNNKGGHFEDKSPTMSSSSWDRNNFLCQRQQKNLKGDNEKANTFLSTSWKGSQANGMTLVEQGFRIRRLTPTECSRLQTIPEWYRWECSDTQAYRMLGNGWTVDVIVHILSFIKEKLNINVA